MNAIEHPARDRLDKERRFSAVKADRLTRICAALLQAAGTWDDEAQSVAAGCVGANLTGHDSHGVITIPTYIDWIKAGNIVQGAEWAIARDPRPLP